MTSPRLLLSVVYCLVVFCRFGLGQTLPLAQTIDQAIAKDEPRLPALASSPANDPAFLRRVHLDLVGGLPSADETRAFVADKDPSKRQKRIDQLLASPEHAWYWASVLDAWWMERRPSKNVEIKAWRDWLIDG